MKNISNKSALKALSAFFTLSNQSTCVICGEKVSRVNSSIVKALILKSYAKTIIYVDNIMEYANMW